MVQRKRSWQDKLHDSKDLPRVVAITGRMSKRWGTGTVVIPASLEVDAIMRKVPKGRVITINQIRSILAARHNATIGCPITTGIFAWIAAHAAEEIAAQGKKRITPWWRTLKSDGTLNEKYPGGVARQKQRLQAEGLTIVAKGRSKKWMVKDYPKHLAAVRP